MPRLLLALALTTAALVVSLAPAAGAATERRCGDIATYSHPDRPLNVRALGVGCRTARSLARRHYRRIATGERCDLRHESCTIDGWTCARTFFGNSGTRVRCTRGAARVRFIYGV